ncbi:MAG: thiolase domain-containing protein, partial [Candidatus Lokiarchaeota archaeon]|nr:thiolase domain-containing protein [Candidatus Lokiarchaeota archaeon]
NKVAIIGVGHTKFGKLEEKDLLDLLCDASLEAIENSNTNDRDFDAVYISCMLAETLNHMTAIASAVVDRIGLIPAAADHVKNGPASGGSAIKNAFYSIASGACDMVLVAGAEKMTHIITPGLITSAVATLTHHNAERIHGVSLPSLAGMLTRTYMEKYNVPKEWITSVAVKNHKNGINNPYAHFQKEITLEKALTSPIIADPLQLFDICPVSDGGAAMVLCSAEIAKEFCDTPVLITGVGQATDTHIVYEREDLTVLKALQICSKQAYDMAKKTPEDIDVAELHDAFTILEVVQSEDIGFFKKGKGAKAVVEGLTEIGGKIPINPSGGLKARGHPLGATGIAQVIELVWQLRNEAGKRQVQNAQTGITCNFGGFGNNIVSILVERM